MLTAKQREVLRHGCIILDFISTPLVDGISQSNFWKKTNDAVWVAFHVFRRF
jgi:hypothetical protein